MIEKRLKKAENNIKEYLEGIKESCEESKKVADTVLSMINNTESKDISMTFLSNIYNELVGIQYSVDEAFDDLEKAKEIKRKK